VSVVRIFPPFATDKLFLSKYNKYLLVV